MMAIIHSLKCIVQFPFAVPLLSLVVTHCHSLSPFVTRCHSLPLVVSLVVTRCHSLSLVVPCVVIRCHSLSFVVTYCTLICLFINDGIFTQISFQSISVIFCLLAPDVLKIVSFFYNGFTLQ